MQTSAEPSGEDRPRAPAPAAASPPAGGATERALTFQVAQRHRTHSFEIEDARWSRDKQRRDWLKLAALMAGYLIWTMLTYLLEPGLR